MLSLTENTHFVSVFFTMVSRTQRATQYTAIFEGAKKDSKSKQNQPHSRTKIVVDKAHRRKQSEGDLTIVELLSRSNAVYGYFRRRK